MTDEIKSRLLVEFSGVGSATFDVKFENVTPTQLLAIAGYLELKAKNEIIILENKKHEYDEMNKLSMPEKPEIVIGKK